MALITGWMLPNYRAVEKIGEGEVGGVESRGRGRRLKKVPPVAGRLLELEHDPENQIGDCGVVIVDIAQIDHRDAVLTEKCDSLGTRFQAAAH